jgi:hypothetical protein
MLPADIDRSQLSVFEHERRPRSLPTHIHVTHPKIVPGGEVESTPIATKESKRKLENIIYEARQLPSGGNLFHKFRQLEHDVRSFEDDLAEKRESSVDLVEGVSSGEDNSPQESLQDLAGKLHLLKDKLHRSLEPFGGMGSSEETDEVSESGVSSFGPEVVRSLLAVLERQKARTSGGDTVDGEDEDKNEKGCSQQLSSPLDVVFELLLGKDEQSSAEMSAEGRASTTQLFGIENRISSLEKFVGREYVVPSIRGSETSEGVDLMGRVRTLEDAVSVLDRSCTEEWRKKVEITFDKMASVKISEEMQSMKRIREWDGVLYTLPSVLLRLRNLRKVHEENASFVDRVKQISDAQDRMETALSDQEQLLRSVDERLDLNIKSIEENGTYLEERMKQIASLLEKR